MVKTEKPTEAEDRIIIVARLKDVHHPGLQRTVAYRQFLVEPRVAFVTKKQADEIKKDEYIIVEPRVGEPWLKAMGLEFSETNQNTYRTKNPPFTKNVKFAKIIEPAMDPVLGKRAMDTLPELVDVKDEPKEEKHVETREEIIGQLESKGLKAGTDFQPDAEIAALKALLS